MRERRKLWGTGPLVLAFIVGIALGAAVVALGDDEDDAGAAPVTGNASVDRVLKDPDAFDDATVTGTVREIISPRAFTVASSFAGPELLVVTTEPLAAPTGKGGTRPILEGDPVTATGEVRDFDLADFEREVGSNLRREFDSFVGDDLAERGGEPALHAELTTFYPRRTTVTEVSSAKEVADRPGAFYGRPVAVDGRVSRVLPSGALVLDDEVVVLTSELGQRQPRKGEQIRIVGPVRPLDPDQLRLDGKTLPDDELFGALANRPAIVAQSIDIED